MRSENPCIMGLQLRRRYCFKVIVASPFRIAQVLTSEQDTLAVWQRCKHVG